MENIEDSKNLKEPSFVLQKLKVAQQNEIDTRELRGTIHRIIKFEKGHIPKDENKALREELSLSHGKQQEPSNEIENLRPAFCQPPQEILRLIFLSALPPPFLLDPSVSGGPDSPWCHAMRMKKSIVQVCRTWCKVGIEMLYEHVAFRQIGQLPSLCRTLETAADNLGNLVKRISVHCFIPRGYSLLFNTELKRIFNYCPRATRVAFSGPFILPLRHPLPALDIPITHIEYGGTVEFSILHASVARISSGLISLAFHLPKNRIERLWPSIHFERLETLRCGMKGNGEHNLSFIEAAWSMPRLRHLTFEISRDLREGEELIMLSAYRSFCTIHGHGLKFLSIHPVYWLTIAVNYSLEIQPILDQCPILEHLVFYSNNMSTSLTHATVKWIDIWSPQPPWACVGGLTPEGFPALQGIRMLDAALSSLPDIPIWLPPNFVNTFGAFEYRFPGIHIRHDPGYLCQNDVAETENEVDDSDSDYVFPTEDDNDGSGNDTSDGSGNDTSDGSEASCIMDAEDVMPRDEFYHKEDWEADRETAITAYLKTLG